MNIIIFSVSIGNGHDQVANTLRNEIIRQNNNAKVKIINTINLLSPILDKVILDSYLNILKFYPKAWGTIYARTDKVNPLIDINDIANKLISSKLRKSINNFNPNAIICTHSFPSSIISALKQRDMIECPLISTITDFTIHSSWINAETDYYVIAHENLSYLAEMYHIPSSKILPYGIPVRPDFSKMLNHDEILSKLDLSNKRTILVMGGGLGLGAINNIVKELDNKFDDIQILAVAGRNNRLEAKLKSLKTNNRLMIYGFISNIHELMEISDCIISKPGGVTTAEILCKKKPLVIFSPLPGQESENTEYLLNSGVAVTANDIKKIPPLIKQILNFEPRLRSIQQISDFLCKPNAAYDTVKYIIDNYS